MKLPRIILFILFLSTAVFAQTKRIDWKVDNLKKIGGQPTTLLGAPKVVRANKGKAVEFDGSDDGIFLETNPLEGFSVFTIEAVFRPDKDGGKEQRWFHIEQTAPESRVLIETRLVGDEWFLDTFMKSGESRLPLYAENFKHKLGEWFHVALVYDGSEMRHYVNGQLELSGKIDFKPMGKGRASLGVRQNKVYWFKGAIGKVRFTNKVLTPQEFKLSH